MDEIRGRLEKELHSVIDRLRQLGSAVVIEEFPGAVPGNGPSPDPWDDVQVHEAREVSFATRDLLVERANRLAEALERLREGTYGACAACGDAIAPARLRAMPEVTTCLRCQDRLERTAAFPGRTPNVRPGARRASPP